MPTPPKKNATADQGDEARAERRREQTYRSVKKHRAARDRCELLLPKGWRDKLHAAVYAGGKHATTQGWFVAVVAELIGEEPPAP